MRRRLFNLCALVSTLTCLAVMVLAHESRQLFFAIERGFWDEGFFSGFNSNRAHWAAYESAIEIPHWALAVLLAVLPAIWCTRVVTARR